MIVMTTNAGAQDLERASIGFADLEKDRDCLGAINRLFTPEFRNRLDAVVPFSNLPPEVVVRVVEKFILELEMQLSDRNVIIEVSKKAMDWLVEEGYDPQMGARPMARIIQENIKKPLADELLFGQLKGGGLVTVDLSKDKKLTFKYKDDKPGRKPASRLKRSIKSYSCARIFSAVSFSTAMSSGARAWNSNSNPSWRGRICI